MGHHIKKKGIGPGIVYIPGICMLLKIPATYLLPRMVEINGSCKLKQ